jgi:hypothetical protein
MNNTALVIKIQKYIEALEEQMENSNQDNDIKISQHFLTLRLVISDLKFMLMEVE